MWLLCLGWLFVAPVSGVVVCGSCVWGGCLWLLCLGWLFQTITWRAVKFRSSAVWSRCGNAPVPNLRSGLVVVFSRLWTPGLVQLLKFLIRSGAVVDFKNHGTRSMNQIHGSDPWIRSMDQIHGSDPWIRSMDQIHGSDQWIRLSQNAGSNGAGISSPNLLATSFVSFQRDRFRKRVFWHTV